MAIKGYQGAVDGAGDVRIWKIGHSAEDLAVADSGTAGAYNELEGVVDWKGWYGAYGHTPIAMPNDALSFEGNIDTDIDKGCSGTAIVRRVDINWNWARGLPIFHTVQFAGNGALTFGAATAADAGPPDWDMSSDTLIKLATPAADPVFTELTKLIQARLSIWAAVGDYVDSGTANLVNRATGNLHWMMTIDLHTIDPTSTAIHSTFGGVNSVNDVQIFVDATTYWQSKWTRWKEVGDLTVDIEGEQMVATRLRGMGCGWYDYAVAGTFVGGALSNPAGSDVWTGA